MSSKMQYLCGVPEIQCTGGHLQTDQSLQTKKSHRTSEEAFRCMRRYLIRVEGYTAIGPREFYKEGHPVRVLTKKIRYGGKLRTGKEGTRYQPKRGSGVIHG